MSLKLEIDLDVKIKEALLVAEKCLTEQNKTRVAEMILEQLLKVDPENSQGLLLLGLAKHSLDKNKEAVEIIKKAIEIDPSNPDNYNNLALAYSCLEEYDASVECLKQALLLRPNHYLFLNNLALQYRQLERYDDALEILNLAIENSGGAPQIWSNLAGVYSEMRDLKKTKECVMKALEIDPHFPGAHIDLSHCYFIEGDWKTGFSHYEYRFRHFPQLEFYQKAYDPSKLWDGNADLKGKRFLIYGEQGTGDLIHFCRYAKNLKKLGAYVMVHCDPSLNVLLENYEYIDQVANRDIINDCGDPLPFYDYQCCSMSLPYLVQDFNISGEPYLKPSHTFNIKETYPDTFNIGISWAGSPAHPNDAFRSTYLKYFEEIYNIPKVKLFSLQMDTRERMYRHKNQSKNLSEGAEHMTKIVDMRPMIKNFDDTAAIISGLDLVISVDTSLVHLCGALGVNCWALLPYNPDWRWGIESNKTPWYKSVLLIRQKERHDWKGLFKQLTLDLHKLVIAATNPVGTMVRIDD